MCPLAPSPREVKQGDLTTKKKEVKREVRGGPIKPNSSRKAIGVLKIG